MMPILKAGREKLTDDVPVIDNTLDKYASDKAIFACPADQRFATETGTSYFWNVAINGQALGSLNFMGLIDQHAASRSSATRRASILTSRTR
jgi:hypothetical protein